MENLKKSSVLLLGYDLALTGGVTKVTRMLLENMEELELHPVLFCYKPIYLSISKTFFSYLKFIFKITSNPSKYKIIKIIVGSSGDAVRSVPFILVSKLFNKKICIQYHKSADIIIAGIPGYSRSPLIKIWNKYVDLHVFLSDNLVSIHKKYISDDISFSVIPNAIGSTWLDTEILPLSSRNRDIVFFGRWSWEKGIDDLTAAMAIINHDIICEIYTNVKPDRYHRNCRIFSWVSEKRVLDIIKTAKIIVLPSYSEAYPTVLLEAVACGTPFISTNIAGIPDIAKQSGAGEIIEPGSVDSLTELINKMITDEKLWHSYSNSGKEWLKLHNIDSIIKKWRVTYQELLK